MQNHRSKSLRDTAYREPWGHSLGYLLVCGSLMDHVACELAAPDSTLGLGESLSPNSSSGTKWGDKFPSLVLTRALCSFKQWRSIFQCVPSHASRYYFQVPDEVTGVSDGHFQNLSVLYIYLQLNKVKRNIQSEQTVENYFFQFFTADLQETNQSGSGVVWA